MADKRDDEADEKEAAPKAGSKPPPAEKKSKKKKNAAEVQKELRELSKGEEKPPVDLKKLYLRVGAVAAIVWVIAIIVPGWIPKAVAGALSVAAVVAIFWLHRYVQKTQKLGAILK